MKTLHVKLKGSSQSELWRAQDIAFLEKYANDKYLVFRVENEIIAFNHNEVVWWNFQEI